LISKAIKTIIFDCDGVLLNSNGIKSAAMFDAASIWGKEQASELVDYHKQNAGIDREIKFLHFFKIILGCQYNFESDMDLLRERYSFRVKEHITDCDEAPSLRPLLASLRDLGIALFVASGANQAELRAILSKRGLSPYFDGIFGAPDSKIEILGREISIGNMSQQRLFLGDSKYDWEAAKVHDCEFMFVSEWTDFKDGESFFAQKNIKIIPHLGHLSIP
jgi:phosphoglycolate phosphatase-like HAD superfamily hydrolase